LSAERWLLVAINSVAASAYIYWSRGTFDTLKRLFFGFQAAFLLSFGWLVALKRCLQAVFNYVLGLLSNGYMREQL
jgi:hypothetical protein